MTDHHVRCRVDAGVATVTLLHPSLTRAVRVDLLGALAGLADRDDVSVVVLTGSGRVFCAGQDLHEHGATLEADPGTAFESLDEHYAPVIRTLSGMPQPVVAGINGSCAGGGLGLALAADIRVAAAGARFALAFTGIGLAPDCGVSVLLARAVGAARASELVLRNRTFTAEEAAAWGLVGTVVAAADLPNTVQSVAAQLAGGSAPALAASKRLLRDGWDRTLDASLAEERRVQQTLGETSYHRAAIAEFVGGRRSDRR
ncbi:enoyl-CoA hydratase/isomerase family protein [Blastococcus sp. URHD0036]|uniref:enoyl-CoA hydratase/isomerase family protein n=1 Tax=Blastococcus sp. URHD0036 TaxID=1380356 RepID=UPI00049604DE|nr:enoyl-CoA hydratase-related protein [Blastococcus sp. URHD0036]